MSKSIDERVVSMQFDNSKFETNAKQTMSTLDKLKQSLKFDKASEGLESVSKAAGNVKLDGISGACETVQAKFSALQVAAVTALANITNKAVDAGQRIVSALTIDGAKAGFSEYEEKMGSVQTIMNGTGESLDTVMGYLEELNRYADQTIYSFSDMTSSIGKFTNAGVDLKTSVAAIQGISNAVALSGGAADKASMAMYNFAQALSIGYVGLTDWKSIELSGMATLDFKKQVMDTAVSLGTLRKEADGTYRTIEKGTEVTAEGMRETLKQQWFTSDVLTTVLAKYADQTTELGQKATEAATKVKTFSMMIDTLQEGIGSGWALTFEKLIGDFNQASDLFTNATNAIQAVIDAQADARNKFIDDAFNKGGNGVLKDVNDWTKLAQTIRNAGGDVGHFKEILIDTAREHGVNINEMIKEAGNFNDTLQNGWLSSDLLDDAIKNAQMLGQLSPEFQSLASAVTQTNKPFQDLLGYIDETSGRTHALNSITNIFKALSAVIKPVKEAFRDIFPAKTGEDLKNALANFEKFTETLIISDDTAKRIKTTFTGFFKVLQTGIETVRSIIDAFSPLKDIFLILVENLLLGAEGLGEFFNTLSDGDTEVSLFQKILNAIHDTLQTFADNLQSYIDKAKNAIITLKETLSQSWDTGALSIVATVIERIKTALSGFTEGASKGLKEFFNTMGQGVADGSAFDKVTEIFTKFCDGMGKVAKVLGDVLKPVIEKIKTFFSEFDVIDSIAKTFEAGGLAAIAAIIGNFIDNILDFKDQVGVIAHPVETMCGFVQQLGDLFGSIEENLRVNVVKDFALSVGILAGSIVALSSIDADGAKQAVGIVTLLTGELVGLFIALDKLSTVKSIEDDGIGAFFISLKNTFGQIKQGAALITMAQAIQKFAVSILILAAAMKIISTIPFPEMAASFVVLSALLWEMVGVTKALSKNEKDLVKGCGALITLSSSVMILSVAMKLLSTIGWPEMIASGIALSILIGELVAVCKLLDGNKGVTGAGAMIALAAAVLILAGAMKIMGSMSFEEISAGLFAIAGVLIELGVALALMPAALPGAAALLIASAALVVLAGALKLMSTINPDAILPILGLLGGVLIELAVGLTAMILALPGAIALVTVAKGLAILTPVLMALGAVPAKNIYKALGEIAVALIGFGVIGTILGVVSPLILAFSAALLVFGVAVAAIGGGLALAGAGLTALATAFGLLSEIGKEAAERIVETLQIILQGVITLIPNMVKAFGEGLIQICEVFIKGAPTIKEALSKLFEILIQVIGEHIPDITEAFTTMILAMLDQAVTLVPAIVEAFNQIVTGILQSFADNLPAMIQAGIDIMVAFIEGVQSAQNQLIDAAMTAMINFVNGLAESIRTNTPLLIAAVNNLMDAVIQAMILIVTNGKPELLVKAKELMESFKAGIIEKYETIKNAIKTMVNNCIDAIKGKVSEFRQAGSNLIDGFTQGIKDKVGNAVESVRQFGSDCLNKLKDVLDIHSPSKATEQLGKYFGEGFAKGMSEENGTAADSSQQLANSATESMNSAIDSMLESIRARSDDFQLLGSTMMEAFAKGINESVTLLQEAINTTFTAIFIGAQSTNTSATLTIKTILESIVSMIRSYYSIFYTEGQWLMNRFVDGSRSRDYYMRLTWNSILQSCITNIRNQYNTFYSSGQYLVDGFINGISSKISAAAQKAAEMAKAAADAAKANLDINSPSRVFAEIGGYVGQGFINGIAEYEGASANAGMALAMRAVKAASEMVEEGIDTNPVITPVIDLTDVENGTRQLSAMLSRTQAISVNTNMNQASLVAQQTNQNGATQQAPQTTFIQNNYSPKALSRIEIYRQTNNQLSRMNGALV